MRWIWVAMLATLSAGALAGEMWRWTDERGVVHYSDRPHPGAERVDIGPAQTFPSLAPAPERPAAPPPAAAREPVRSPLFVYTRFSVVSPAQGETLWNLGGELNVELAVEPPLAPQHVLRVFLDGAEVKDVPQGDTRFTVGEVFRGERRLRVAVVDAQGRELASTDPVVFYVQQASLLNPNRPQRAPGGG
jgi:hypothetical protein